ncbi:MAG: pseudouridine synthase [archaeon]
MERVQKIIASSGLCSKRKAEELIAAGVVQVNGNTIKLGNKADYEKDIITVNSKRVIIQNKVYYAFNKPKFVLTSATEEGGKKTIYSYIDIKERVYYAGRLDFDAEGLLILTNDGDFANLITHPSNEIKKTYRAFIDKDIDEESITKLRNGVELEDGKTSRAKVVLLSPRHIEVTIHEGKKHIIKRMFESLGFNVIRLIRTKVGGVTLGNLKPGEYRKLTMDEIERILSY